MQERVSAEVVSVQCEEGLLNGGRKDIVAADKRFKADDSVIGGLRLTLGVLVYGNAM
ncbi:hypothetical protein ACXM2N_00035 [Corynebacterium sp. ZY180755]